MKAAVLYKANTPLEVVDVKQEGPRAGEARVRVKAAGVCHSDWHIMNGDWTVPLPMVLGHEAAGIVEDVGAGVTTVKPGDHVIFSFRPQCGHCLYCSIGRSVLCDGHNDTPRWVMFDGTPRLSRNGEGLNQLARIGTFSEMVVCPAEQLVPIRKDMPWPQAALVGCCVPTGVGAVTRCAEVEAGASVLVIGCGGVGLNVVQGARLAGAATIIACDLLDSKLTYAKASEADFAFRRRREEAIGERSDRGEIVLVNEPLPGEEGYAVRYRGPNSVRFELVRRRGSDMLVVRVSREKPFDTIDSAALSKCELRARAVQEQLMFKLRWRD